MRLDYRNSWLRVLVELLEPRTPIRRYRVVPADLERQLHRLLKRRITRHMRSAAADNQG